MQSEFLSNSVTSCLHVVAGNAANRLALTFFATKNGFRYLAGHHCGPKLLWGIQKIPKICG